MHIIQLYAKTHECSLKNLSKSSAFALWSSLAFSTATLFLFALLPMILFPAYSPPCKTLKSRRVDPLEYFWFMQLQPLVSVQIWFSQKLALTSFCFWQTNLATLFIIQRDYDLEFWPPQELPRCPWHSVEHLVFMDSFGIVLCLHYDLALWTNQHVH